MYSHSVYTNTLTYNLYSYYVIYVFEHGCGGVGDIENNIVGNVYGNNNIRNHKKIK